jgi:4-amino-4-deoxy-L-arabinose transferase-like glycosyltransferase
MQYRAIVIIFLIALSPRVLLFLSVEPWKDEVLRERILWDDARGYHRLAVNLVEHNIFSQKEDAPYVPEIGRTPVYPTFLAITYSIFGVKPCFAIIFQLVISSLTCIFVYKIGKTLFSEKIALLASILVAFEYAGILYSNLLLTETLFTFIFIIHIYFLVRFFETNHNKNLISSAIFLGISSLCRPVSVYFFIFLMAIFYIHYKNNFRKGISAYMILCAAFLMTIFPWMIRNYVVAGKFLVSYQQISALSWHNDIHKHFKKEQKQDHNILEKRNKNQATFAIKNTINVLLSYSKKISKGTSRFFTIIGSRGYTHVLGISGDLIQRKNWDKGFFHAIKIAIENKAGPEKIVIFWGITFLIFIYFLTVFGIFSAIKTKNFNKIILYIFIVFYFVITSAPFAYTERYRVPVMPYMIIIACYGVSHFQRRFHRHESRESAANFEK